LHKAAGPLDGSLGEIDVLADYARALRIPPPPAPDEGAPGTDQHALESH
jgi:hypothetical protein